MPCYTFAANIDLKLFLKSVNIWWSFTVALCCWKMNLLEICHVVGRNCCDSIKLWQQASLTLILWSAVVKLTYCQPLKDHWLMPSFVGSLCWLWQITYKVVSIFLWSFEWDTACYKDLDSIQIQKCFLNTCYWQLLFVALRRFFTFIVLMFLVGWQVSGASSL